MNTSRTPGVLSLPPGLYLLQACRSCAGRRTPGRGRVLPSNSRCREAAFRLQDPLSGTEASAALEVRETPSAVTTTYGVSKPDCVTRPARTNCRLTRRYSHSPSFKSSTSSTLRQILPRRTWVPARLPALEASRLGVVATTSPSVKSASPS
jgi:hypothetical protein